MQLWRLLTANLVFTKPGEAIFGLYLLYHFRVFERQQGSRKYGTFLALCVAMSTGMQIALLPALRATGWNGTREPFASGPHALVFAHFVPFFMDIPCIYHFTIFGVRFSNKAFVYLAGAQILLAHATRYFAHNACVA